MSLNNLFQFLVPKDTKFFPLFEEATTNLVNIASTLNEAVNLPPEEREKYFLKIDNLGEKAEKITRNTNIELSSNFITPFDREDIYSLVAAIDYVASYLAQASSRMRLYHVEKITKSIRKLTEINLEACEHIHTAVKELKGFKNIRMIANTCSKISKLENKSDAVYNKAVFDLFENETDAKNIIKYKEVLSVLESATDKCKSVARVLEAIKVKHS